MPIIYALGEGVADFIMNEGKGDDDYKLYPGGASLLAACMSAQILKNREAKSYAAPVMRVGSDDLGRFLVNHAAVEGCSTRFIVQGDTPTTQLYLRLDKNGECECAGRESGADLELNTEDVMGIDFRAGDVLYISSNGFLTQESNAAHKYALRAAVDAGAKVCFDVNLRLALWRGRDLLKAFTPYFKKADVIKLKEKELAAIFINKDFDENMASLFAVTKEDAVIHVVKRTLERLEFRGRKLVDEVPYESTSEAARGDAFIAGVLADMAQGL